MSEKLTKKNAAEVFDNLMLLTTDDHTLRKGLAGLLAGIAVKDAKFCKAVDAWLDDQLSNDAFGTEGQLDPRGDHRDDEEDES